LLAITISNTKLESRLNFLFPTIKTIIFLDLRQT